MSDHDDDFPCCRATIRDGTVTLNRWRLGMGAGGPLKAGYLSVTAVLADLYRQADGELLVTAVRGVPWTDEAGETLVAWAARAGYRRVWLPDRVVELDPLAEAGDALAVCPTCGARWEDGGPAFWEQVRRDGWFPGGCLACGGSLPEWSVRQEVGTPSDPAPRTAIPGGTPCT